MTQTSPSFCLDWPLIETHISFPPDRQLLTTIETSRQTWQDWILSLARCQRHFQLPTRRGKDNPNFSNFPPDLARPYYVWIARCQRHVKLPTRHELWPQTSLATCQRQFKFPTYLSYQIGTPLFLCDLQTGCDSCQRQFMFSHYLHTYLVLW